MRSARTWHAINDSAMLAGNPDQPHQRCDGKQQVGRRVALRGDFPERVEFQTVDPGAPCVKMLLWEGDGFVIWYKRLEAGTFAVPAPGDWSQPLDHRTDLLDGVIQMIDAVLVDSRIDPRRVYLVGVSTGGYGTWELATRCPDRFAAVVPICGGGDVGRVDRLVDVPIWAVHGTVDDVVPVTEMQTLIAALERADGKPRFLVLAGVGHLCWDEVFRPESEILAWMFRQVRDPSQTSRSGGGER